MQTKIIRSIGPNSNPRNLTTIGYCIEAPLEVLKYALEQGYLIGGYRQAGETRPGGAGLVIRGTDMEPVEYGLEVTGQLEDIPFDKYELEKGKVTDADLKWMIGNRGGVIQAYRNYQYVNLFSAEKQYLTPGDAIIMATAREFIEAVKGEPVPLEYLVSLSK